MYSIESLNTSCPEACKQSKNNNYSKIIIISLNKYQYHKLTGNNLNPYITGKMNTNNLQI